ncbi:MAG: hypothetical protein ACTMII_03725 [Brachybacterium sp.]|uniref:hypothetical protein n=1 Tax=unclassified Brachybacterium TaxID=2623841 RepID=UPI003F8FE069
MRSFLSGLTGHHPPQGHPLLEGLRGQTIVHTRVASRGTWTITARGWVLQSRIQQLDGPALTDDPPAAVGLRDPRLVGAAIHGTELLGDGLLRLALQSPQGPLRLSTVPRWRLEAPRGALLQIADKGEITSRPAGPPLHATPAALAEHAASTRSGIEERLLAMGREQWLHPGHVVTVLANAGALDDAEFERRGPLLLARLIAREEIRAGFVTAGRFTPWNLPTQDIIEHIATTWTAIGGRTPDADMIAWFELTDLGRAALGPTSDQTMPPGMSGYDSPGVVGGAR